MAQIDAPPIISNFSILGLYGYKNISIDFTGPVRIVIAENGMGKNNYSISIASLSDKKILRATKPSFRLYRMPLYLPLGTFAST